MTSGRCLGEHDRCVGGARVAHHESLGLEGSQLATNRSHVHARGARHLGYGSRWLLGYCEQNEECLLAERYATWESDLGAEIEAGKHSFATLEKRMLDRGEVSPNRSGRQEMIENLINCYL